MNRPALNRSDQTNLALAIYHYAWKIPDKEYRKVRPFGTLPDMPATDLVVVDIAAWWVTAVFESEGFDRPVLFDGRARAPSGVFQLSGVYTAGTTALTAGLANPESYRPDPMTLLRHGGPPAAVAAVLSHVAERTGRPAALTVVTAQEWDRPARDRLESAATIAGLPRPRIVSTAVAAAAPTGPGVVLVCVAGAAWPELTLVDGQRHLAASAVRAPGAPAIDEALLRVAAARGGAEADPDDWRLTREVERARATLGVQQRAAMLLPEPHQAVVLTRDDLTAAKAVHLDRLPDTVKLLLADAGVDRVTAVVQVGEDAQVATALSDAGLVPAITVRDPHALLRGIARTQPPSRRLWWRR
ncbi:hypothetical protein BC793_1062 [Actinoplanes xinjiangensis]|uniref:Uncharacterized protein n=2 Tax=Actinoplanes xinjiangensis TaxID=512350 RepID=A0A316FIN6_9ACTN|nr:hypothetical protein BC793_1062 [Actinoplanes xinjiangensis]GIF39276.1 hypothetical protein Axi01nite_35870 [Actinoplanes xinjiangensis]